MAKSKALKGRIRSVQNTRKITRTMELVATSKLKRAQDRVVAARPYAEALAGVIADLVTPELAERFPLLRRPAPPAHGGPVRAAVLLVTSNRGLAGGFNANLIKEARRRIDALEAEGYQVELHSIGRKGAGFFRYLGRPLASQAQDPIEHPSVAAAAALVESLLADYAAGTLAGVDLVCARFLSPMSTPPTTLRVLPVEAPARKSGGAASYILRPGADEIVGQLLPLYVRNQVYRGLVETSAAEHGARRTAMKNATDNAGEILDVLRRTYNRQRQAQITQEIAEIVGGAAALQG
ncbi:MAG TPA: ATP synthase F1 subunit gamma [Gemmatimonadales bacterium]|nr:ATP synthase F1 subunit gamma [Gemmatimonadales bacterium]